MSNHSKECVTADDASSPIIAVDALDAVELSHQHGGVTAPEPKETT